ATVCVFNDPPPTGIYSLSLHDALPICKLEEILASPAALKRTVVREIEADAKAHGDARRTLVQEEKKVVAELRVVDEPVTVVVSRSEEHTSELQSRENLVCRLLLEKKKK